MKQKGLLTVSFGTSYEAAEKRCIHPVEQHMEEKYKDAVPYRAYTSGRIREILKKRGRTLWSVEEALDKMEEDGIRTVLVRPTLLLYGEEYSKIERAIEQRKNRFEEIFLGSPLLGSIDNIISVSHILHKEYPLEKEECLVLMGHGTKHFCNTVYPAMENICHEQGYKTIFVGTIESYPDVSTVIKKIKEAGLKKAILIPLMLVAGDHAMHDMAGDGEKSWKSMFLKENIMVRPILKGLGEYPEIRELLH